MGLEPDIVDDRLQFYISQSDRPPTSHDAVDGTLSLSLFSKACLRIRM